MIIRKTLFSIVLLSLLVLVACSDDEENNGTGPGLGKPPAGVLGTWTFQSVTVNGVAAPLDSVLGWTAGTVSAEFTIQADGTYWYQEVNQNGGQLWSESGFVFVDGANIDINIQFNTNGQANEMKTGTFSISGNSLTLQLTEPGVTLVFSFVNNNAVLPADLIASWTFQSVTVNGTASPIDSVQGWKPTTVRSTFTILADRSYRLEEFDANNAVVWLESGVIFVDRSVITINTLSDSDGPVNETSTGTFSISGNTLTVQVIEVGDNLIFTLTK